MASPQMHSLDEETATQKQARIRRERREAKIKAGGSARLDKITSLSGRPAESSASPVPSNPTTPSPSIKDPSTDPDEVDISNHPYTSSRSSSHPYANEPTTEAEIRRLMRSGAPPPGRSIENPFRMGFAPGQLPPPPPLGAGAGNGNQDAIMGLLQQMMGGEGMPGGSPGGGGAEAGGLPPGLAAMLGAGAGAGGAGPGSEQALDRHAYLWKVVHALLALALGVYMATTVTTFSGARFLRDGDNHGRQLHGNRNRGGAAETPELTTSMIKFQFFWAFATAELGLQSARFFLDRGRGRSSSSSSSSSLAGGGWLEILVHALPEPWAAWVMLWARYAAISTTVVQDAMVVVFVLGVVAWWRGEVGG